MKLSMTFPIRYEWGTWGQRKKKTNQRGKSKSTKLRNKRGYKKFLNDYSF